jgi:hypothetical protein
VEFRVISSSLSFSEELAQAIQHPEFLLQEKEKRAAYK